MFYFKSIIFHWYKGLDLFKISFVDAFPTEFLLRLALKG